MKPIITPFIIMLASTSMASNIVSTDSIASKEVELHEVTVQAAPIIRKADRDLFIPSADTKKRSSDGLDLLNNMQIPTISVNTVLGSITKGADSVEVRINGRKSDSNQLQSLSPESIVRIEYIENPGLRYDGAKAVIDFIVKNPNSGGSFRGSVLQSVTNGFGNQNVNLKLNQGRSQWELSYFGHMRLDLPIYRENIERYTLTNGSPLNRTEIPIDGSHNEYGLYPSIAYNYINPDKTNFYAQIYYNRCTSSMFSYDGLLHTDGSDDDILLHDFESSPNTSPGINLYLCQEIGRKQKLVFDVNASGYFGHSIRNYTESIGSEPKPITAIDSRIRDRNFALTAEGNYIKEWSKSQLIAGVRYTVNRNRSTYISAGGAVYHQQKDRIYFFGEYLHRIGKVSLSAGVGGEYNNIHSREADSRVEHLLFQPRLSAAYRIDDASRLQFVFQSYTYTPSLSQMSPVRQDVDRLQASVGNPNLKSYNNYYFSLQYNFNSPRVMGEISAFYYRAPNAIMDYRYWDSDQLVSSYANQSGVTRWGITISPRIVVVPDWITINGSFNFGRQYTRGIGYRHCYTAIYGNASFEVAHWGFSLRADYNHGFQSLWGESITRGEHTSTIALNYNYKNWQFTAGMLMPFDRYSQGTETINRYANIERAMRTKAIEHMPFLRFAYNLSWGRKSHDTSKLINNDSGVQSSSAAGK